MRFASILLVGLILGVPDPAGAADISVGARLYHRHCQDCHGARGRPNMPGMPDFSRGEALLRPDDRIVDAIRRGQGMMPAFEGRFSAEEFYDLVAYLRTLR